MAIPTGPSQLVEIRGHIIDSLILPKILDCITAAGGSFLIQEISIGQARSDPSFASIHVSANSDQRLEEILRTIGAHGALQVNDFECSHELAELAGVYPERFYSTTNQRTEVRIGDDWIEVGQQEMDCGIELDVAQKTARCCPMVDVRKGRAYVVGHVGVRVQPQTRAESTHSFEFMNSPVSTEKPKGVAIRQIAKQLVRCHLENRPTAIVGGPAIVHTGSAPHLCQLIRSGYVNGLLAGNALATHDIEQAMFGTSLGVRLDCGDIVEAGHEHHLRAINRIRRAGGIRSAVEMGLLERGIMYECVKHDVPFSLAGSIRDDGPLPDVITDMVEAQREMRRILAGVQFCLMIAKTLHSIAVGHVLPAWVQVVCVDINPSTVIKLNDRGSFQTVGLVTDVEPFLRELVQEVEQLERNPWDG